MLEKYLSLSRRKKAWITASFITLMIGISLIIYFLTPLSQSNRPITVAIPANYVGFSMEWNEALIKRAFEDPTSSPDKIVLNSKVLQLFRNLSDAAGGEGAPTLRIGGNNGMFIYWADTSVNAAPSIHNAGIRGQLPSRAITAHSFKVLDAFASSTGVKLIIAVPMRYESPELALNLLKYGLEPNVKKENVMAIELGNEPNHWINDNWLLRNGNYTADNYISEMNTYIQEIKKSFDYVFQGPSTAGCNTDSDKKCWDQRLPDFAAANNALEYVSYHRYGNSGCGGKNVTMETILSDPPSTGKASYEWILPIQSKLAPMNRELVFGEGNVANCVGLGAKLDVTLTFASTLWALDNLFEPAYRGVRRANLHGIPSAPYAPIYVDTLGNLSVRPVYYAMIVFNSVIAGSHSVIEKPTDPIFATDLLKVWIVKEERKNRLVHIYIHKDWNQKRIEIDLKPNGSFRKVIVKRLTAPSINATSGITFAGKTFDNTSDGQWTGSVSIEEIILSETTKLAIEPLTAVVVEFN